MKQQIFKNHSKLVPLFHGVTGLMLLIGVSGAIVNFIQALGNGSSQLEAGLFLLLFILSCPQEIKVKIKIIVRLLNISLK